METAQPEDRKQSKPVHKPIIIPIASGKGGVGKTLLAANLGLALAARKHRTVVVDLDLGSPNLHSFLGIANMNPGIGDYLKARLENLDSLLTETPFENLFFLAGDGSTPFMANITHKEKQKLLNNLVKFDVEYILLDLGPGTAFNVLDFFSLATSGLIVSIPEFPSLLSLLGFMKNLLLRIIQKEFKGIGKVEAKLGEIFRRPMSEKPFTIDLLVEELAKIKPSAVHKIENICKSFRPGIVFNMGRHPDELNILKQLNRGAAKVLSIQADYFGFIFDDPSVRTAIRTRKPVISAYPDSPAALEITQIAKRVEKYWLHRISDSDQLLIGSTRKFYDQIPASPD